MSKFNSGKYWEDRYMRGGNSGTGSYGPMSEFKAEVVNKFIKDNDIKSVLELGCGDGHQLGMFDVDRYIGLDVSGEAISMCRRMYKNDLSKKFAVYTQPFIYEVDLALSLDVIFHLVEDEVYKQYMKDLFSCSKYVIIYSSNTDEQVDTQGEHMKQRKFSDDIKGWKLVEKIDNEYPYNKETGEGSLADFYIYKKLGTLNR